MDLLSTLIRSKPSSLKLIHETLNSTQASEEVLELIKDAIDTWERHEALENGSVDISDYGFFDAPNVSTEEIKKEVSNQLELLRAVYQNTKEETVKKRIEYWESYDPLIDPSPGKELFIDYGDISYELFSWMVDFAGHIWALLYRIDYLLQHHEWSIENVKVEINKIVTFKEYVYSLPEEFLYSDIPENNERNNEAREYYRIWHGFYGLNPIESISINNTTSWVYGRYIKYYYFLSDKLLELEDKVTARQHALICHYKQNTGNMVPFGFKDGSVERALIRKDSDTYAKENGLDDQTFYSMFNEISIGKYASEKRTKNDTNNLHDLKMVIDYFESSPDSVHLFEAIALAKNDLIEIRGGATAEQIAYIIYYKIASGEMEPFKRDKTKVLTEINKVYGRKGFKHLEEQLRSAYSAKHRQSGVERNIDTLRVVITLLGDFPNAKARALADLRKAEKNKIETEGDKRRV